MARVYKRRAAKDYPDQGISKGDYYFFCQIKTGQRSSRIMRSLNPFKQSQLTTSPFKCGWYSAMESVPETADMDEQSITDLAQQIAMLGEEAGESFENMPEGLQHGPTGQLLEERRDGAETVVDTLNTLSDEWGELEEPAPNTDPLHKDAHYEAVEDYESEKERIRNEVDEAVGDMPE